MGVKSVLIKGPFTEDDLLELTAAFRRIEQRQPEQPFGFLILKSDLSLAEGEALIRRIFPYLEDDEPTFVTIRPH